MQTAESLYEPLVGPLLECFPELALCRSTAELEAHPVYRKLRPDFEKVLGTIDTGDFTRAAAPPRERYRVAAWNIERGMEFPGQLEALRTHPYLRECDVLLLTEADLGMARSGNRDVAQELARGLGMHYAFAPCYLNLAKGCGVERDVPGENALGLHGNAVLSRYPITAVRAIRLHNGVDKMARREKRIGRQSALAADIDFPNLRLTAVSVHLDAQSTQRHRRDQMADVIAGLDLHRPVLLGGDWNTSTYNSSTALHAILGYSLRVLIGVDHVIRNHYLHPYRHFERGLFSLLEKHGFDYRSANVSGEPTGCYDIADTKARRNLGEWVPGWCFAFIRWALRNHGGRCPLKLDWLAARGLRTDKPTVIHGLGLSDHDPIGVEITAY
ncbi:MAG TPA: endonuclease/exonuclease/phosphatase family protein [Bryobacteraceae bacterium]|nr:endonuclease/exonuclease/phosphatase family protein [Bryobacteraceae bacterium]